MSESVIGSPAVKDTIELDATNASNVATNITAICEPTLTFTANEQILFTTQATIKFVIAEDSSGNSYRSLVGGYPTAIGQLLEIHATRWPSQAKDIRCNLVVYPHLICYKYTGNPPSDVVTNGYSWRIFAFVCF